MKVDIITE